MPEAEHKNWSGKTDGTTWMQRSLITLTRIFGLRPIYAVVAMVIPFYMLFNRKGYKSMYSYFRKRHGKKPLAAVWHVYRNHFVFGKIIIDRFAAYGGRHFELEITGQELYDEMTRSDEGAIMLSSHIGNYELAGYLLNSSLKPFNALVFSGESETVMANRNRLLSGHGVTMIPVSNDMSHIFALNAALDRGEIVSLPADRIFGSSKSVSCEFLGAKALLPLGAFTLAAHKDVPVTAIFVMKESTKKYNIHLFSITTECTGIRTRSQALAQKFADKMAAILEMYPHQWFNYYEFWDTPSLAV